ncbi:MAG: FAA hydrolase family protein [Thermoactinomycetaceae bacterium]|nr:FAA hydrolase family protein [Thermoactinomycetaceae bacterium]
MKLLTFRTEKGLKTGVKTDRGVLEIPDAMETIVERGETALRELADRVDRALRDGAEFLPEEELTLGPCVPHPEKILCIGLNYRKHAEESNMPIPEYPILFNKFRNALVGSGEPVPIPREARQVDYEAELAIVIGRTARNVRKEEAMDCIFGYCAANDLSARDLQFRTHQWLLGKSCDGFCPLGPYLVTRDEVEDPHALGIRSFVNGKLRQNSSTADMIFRCDELVSYISRYMTLRPGDVILTGTPEGVIMGYPEDRRVWLRDGDEVAVEIDGLGRLTNRLVQGD